jgi:hypothetical protein
MSEVYSYKPGEVEAERFFWELFNSEKWDHLFSQKILPRIITIVPTKRFWSDIESRSIKEQVQVVYLEESSSSSVTIGMKKVPSRKGVTWHPNSVAFDIYIITKNKAGVDEKDIISVAVSNVHKKNT